MLCNRRGQSTLEYALIFTAVVAALLAISVYMTRGMQGKLKESTDSIGRQFDPGNFTNAWKTASTGTTVSNENRVAGGQTTTNINSSETITRDEYNEWGTKPTPHNFEQ